MVQAGLVLEGGGMKGIYTAGVLDFFMEKDLYFQNVYGVSAGACHLCSYISRQPKRAYHVSLDYLKDNEGASQKEIAAGCLIEAGSLTSILNRMEEKGLIERKMLNGNRRTFHIFMTESGKKNQKLVEEAFKKIEKTALNGISEEEQKLFMDIFCRIYRNLADMK